MDENLPADDNIELPKPSKDLSQSPKYACPHCQAEAKEGDVFCPRCGKAYHQVPSQYYQAPVQQPGQSGLPMANQWSNQVPVQKKDTNTLAIVSFILSICFFLTCGITAIPGFIVGFIARKQIKESNGAQGGDGFAIAGIVIGILGTLMILGTIALIALGTFADTGNSDYEEFARLASYRI
jgi:uncharacterized membrane protein